jgi:AraC-like DNA-binding protein
MEENRLLERTLLPRNGTILMHEDKWLVMDYLNRPFDVAEEEMAHFVRRLPLRLTFNCMIIVVEGKVTIGVNCNNHVMESNSCAFITTASIVERIEVAPETRLIVLSMPEDAIPTMAESDRSELPLRHASATLWPLQPIHVEMLISAYRMLRVILSDPAFAERREETARDCIGLIMTMAGPGGEKRGQRQAPQAQTSRKDAIVERFMQCVQQNYREHRDVGFYAEQLGLSLKYMSRVIFEQTGRHPSRWIKDLVILDAKSMLRSGRYSVQQVADELNFPNQSFFGKYFKEDVGVSPKKWC